MQVWKSLKELLTVNVFPVYVIMYRHRDNFLALGLRFYHLHFF